MPEVMLAMEALLIIVGGIIVVPIILATFAMLIEQPNGDDPDI